MTDKIKKRPKSKKTRHNLFFNDRMEEQLKHYIDYYKDKPSVIIAIAFEALDREIKNKNKQ